MTRRAFAWAGAGLVLAIALVVTAAPLLGLGRVNPFAQLVSARGLLAVLAAVLALAALAWFLVHWFRRRRFSPRSKRRPAFPRISLVLTLGFALLAAGNGVVLAQRGVAPSGRATVEGLAAIPERSDEITVLTLNTQWARVEVEEIVRLTLASSADVLILPETDRQATAQIVDALMAEGHRYSRFPQVRDNAMRTSILVAESVGTYTDAGEPVEGAARAIPDGHGPVITGVHPLPPSVPWPVSLVYGHGGPADLMERWSRQLDEALGTCGFSDWGIVAGDFNATPDHADLAGECGYVDALVAVGAGGWGTWPTRVPSFLGAPIDHILVDPDHWTPVAGWVVDVPGTDHRAVVARLLPRAAD